MSNQFSGVGNIGQAPVLRQVTVGSESRALADLRVYFDRPVPQGEGKFGDEGGFWLGVSVWGPRAETAVRVLRKGARIQVDGQLREECWDDEDGNARSAIRLTAYRLAIDPLCIESVTYRQKNDRPAAADGVDDDVPY